ncbi:hypothetical protein CNECB9_3120010 [Cupriavidus necator]|uniref:Uncharacterized protein n=1 Tax=Cupriavidus necator TaxID=106590 RepID=A0A1K0JMR1_CUPNE|nr:hypothetical protein CNECB9_3120010 [Cupriavidus necator]
MVKHPMIQEKVGVAPHEMTVPAATDCRRASGLARPSLWLRTLSLDRFSRISRMCRSLC